jgi:transcription elongation factor GreA
VNKDIILTEEGYNEIKKELDYLRGEARNQIAEKIKNAREYGDLSENAEYEDAKNEQAFLEGKILELERKLSNAKVAKKTKKDGVVNIGSRVLVLDTQYNEELTYTILGSGEGDPDNGKISNESPLGSALIGKKAGDSVEFSTPNGIVVFKVISVE